MIAAALPRGHGYQVQAALLVIGMCLALHIAARPYEDKAQNNLETASLVVSCFTLWTGVVFVGGGLSDAAQWLLTSALFIANVGMVIALLYTLGVYLRRRKQEQEARRARDQLMHKLHPNGSAPSRASRHLAAASGGAAGAEQVKPVANGASIELQRVSARLSALGNGDTGAVMVMQNPMATRVRLPPTARNV